MGRPAATTARLIARNSATRFATRSPTTAVSSRRNEEVELATAEAGRIFPGARRRPAAHQTADGQTVETSGDTEIRRARRSRLRRLGDGHEADQRAGGQEDEQIKEFHGPIASR